MDKYKKVKNEAIIELLIQKNCKIVSGSKDCVI